MPPPRCRGAEPGSAPSRRLLSRPAVAAGGSGFGGNSEIARREARFMLCFCGFSRSRDCGSRLVSHADVRMAPERGQVIKSHFPGDEGLNWFRFYSLAWTTLARPRSPRRGACRSRSAGRNASRVLPIALKHDLRTWRRACAHPARSVGRQSPYTLLLDRLPPLTVMLSQSAGEQTCMIHRLPRRTCLWQASDGCLRCR